MTKRSHRLLKKIHKRWLESDIVDLSQDQHWRKRLFDSPPGQVFAISIDDTLGLRGDAVAAVCRYKLRFSLQRVELSQADAWLSEGGSVVFKFWASNYPSVRIYSGNNPLVVRVT